MTAALTVLAPQRPEVPQHPPADMAVGADYERFANTQAPLPSTPGQPNLQGSGSRPGQAPYDGPVVFTPGYQGGLNNTLGAGQAAMPEGGSAGDRIYRPMGVATYVNAPTIQLRLGVAQHGPSSLGVAQTVELATITSNPPQGATMQRILAGQA